MTGVGIATAATGKQTLRSKDHHEDEDHTEEHKALVIDKSEPLW